MATVESDVYMLGGFIYELLTAGCEPFQWLTDHPLMLVQRLVSARPVAIPYSGAFVSGLLHKNVLEALAEANIQAAEHGHAPLLPWCIAPCTLPGSAGRLETVKALMASCLALDPAARPKLPDALDTVSTLLEEEVAAVAPAPGTPSGGAGAAGSQ